jgi:hypothetical protein
MLVYVEKLQTAAHMWECMINVCDTTSDMIRCVIANWIPHLRLYVSRNGGHIEHILYNVSSPVTN